MILKIRKRWKWFAVDDQGYVELFVAKPNVHKYRKRATYWWSEGDSLDVTGWKLFTVPRKGLALYKRVGRAWLKQKINLPKKAAI